MSQVRDSEAIARAAEARRIQRARLPAVLDYAFRPMFLAAGSWAVVALALWLAMFFGHVQLPTRFDPLAWHVHEMLFGFVMAAVAGFLLTAIPNWTGRLPVRGYPLVALVCLWLHGRIACLISADLPTWLAVLADLAFPVALLAVAAREIKIKLDPFTAYDVDVELPLWKFGLSDQSPLRVEDLMRGHQFVWTGKYQRIRLDPNDLPFSIWRAG